MLLLSMEQGQCIEHLSVRKYILGYIIGRQRKNIHIVIEIGIAVFEAYYNKIRDGLGLVNR